MSPAPAGPVAASPVAPFVPSRHAEDAAALLLRTVGHYRLAQAAIPLATRPRRLGRVPVDRAQEQAQATLVRLMSITEAFTADTLLRHAEPHARPSLHAVALAVYDDAAIAAIRDWQAMNSAYGRWLDVKWSNAPYTPVKTLADARNAVVHGLGTLTRQQTRKNASDLRRRLSLAGAIVGSDDSLKLPGAFIVSAARSCRTFVQHVDEQVQRRPVNRR